MAVHRIGIVKNKKANASAEARSCAVSGRRKRGVGAHPSEMKALRDPVTDVRAARRASGAFDGCLDDIRSTDTNFVFQN
ncbi:hypothetical protein PsorP6_008820 [Peronosclerospora sorghi]|uniref:Uncharacterized protein n=1 Tax=Peronosclerospora sorghi TaxID=230839 RepID=A0ACC0VXQ2_9STRA|nr:hypothetical protein PsorP6_008820 [Peronosclerospora sorghi]